MNDAGFSGTLIKPDWPCPENVQAFCTTRLGGSSQGRYASLNLAQHVHDESAQVQSNRRTVQIEGGLPTEPLWLQQVHGKRVIHSNSWKIGIQADGCMTDQKNTVCTVLTADCLPVLFCNQKGSMVAAIHAGWRSLLDGILLITVEMLNGTDFHDGLVWFGPAISAEFFEVGNEVRDAFCYKYRGAEAVFNPSHRKQHWLMDMVKMAQLQLQSVGIHRFYGGKYCTYSDEKQFFSHRREGSTGNDTGRMATLIWMKE